MKNIFFHIIIATLALWLSSIFVTGVSLNIYPDSNFFGIGFTAKWQIFFILGVILGLLNYFVKPLLNLITLPLRLISFGILNFAINILLILIIDIGFKEINISLFLPLVYTALIFWSLNLVLLMPKKRK